MPRRTLTDSQASLIANSLRVAADAYEMDARQIEARSDLPPDATARLVRGFRDQRDTARALADRFDDASLVTLDE